MGRPGIVTPAPIPLPEYELLARVYRTLGDPTRLRIVETLERLGAASQSELIGLLGISQSRASEHLGCLRWCGFVHAERVGRSVRYRLSGGQAKVFLELAREFIRDNPEAVGGCWTEPEDGKAGTGKAAKTRRSRRELATPVR